MKRRDLYKRTIGYATNGLGFVCFVSYFIIPLLILGAILRPEKFSKILLPLLLFYFFAFGVIFIVYRKYFLDLLFCSTETFCGPVFLGEELPCSVAQSGDLGRRWWVIEQKEGGIPSKFIIFPLILKKYYPLDLSLLDVKKGIFRITYLKRSKCIVEIVRMTEPERDTRSKKGQKKARRKAQHQ